MTYLTLIQVNMSDEYGVFLYKNRMLYKSLLFPDFHPNHRPYSRNPGTVAMLSSIRLRSGTIGSL